MSNVAQFFVLFGTRENGLFGMAMVSLRVLGKLRMFGRTIPRAILPFRCSSHHENLKYSQNFDNLTICGLGGCKMAPLRDFAKYL